jgi:hypothetical protein
MIGGPEQVVVGLVVGLVVLGLPLLIRYLVRLGRGQERIMAVLLGDPLFGPGLVEKVKDLQRSVNVSVAGVGALVADSKPDDGTTGRDVLNRIEAEGVRLRDLDDDSG